MGGRDIETTKNSFTKMNQENQSIIIGEHLFILRPLVYALCLRFMDKHSCGPYFVSLAIDITRLFLQRNVKFHHPAEKHEFKNRNKEMIVSYMLRNPFYAEVFRQKILWPTLNTLLGKKNRLLK